MSENASTMTLEQFEQLLAVAPFHRWLHLSVKTFAPGQLELEMPWRNEIVGNTQIGAVHGGVLPTLIDLAGVYALLAAGHKVKATADMSVDYHRPATRGPLVASSKVLLGQDGRYRSPTLKSWTLMANFWPAAGELIPAEKRCYRRFENVRSNQLLCNRHDRESAPTPQSDRHRSNQPSRKLIDWFSCFANCLRTG